MVFHRSAIIIVAICAAVSLVGGFAPFLSGSVRQAIAGDFATTTIASIDKESPTNIVVVCIVFIYTILGSCLVLWLRRYSYTAVVTGEEKSLAVSYCAVEIRGIPTVNRMRHKKKGEGECEGCKDGLLKEYMNQKYGNKILSARVIPEFRQTLLLIERRDAKELRLTHLVNSLEDKSKCAAIPEKQKAEIQSCYRAIRKLDIKIQNEKKEIICDNCGKATREGTGFAYVIFKDLKTSEKCLQENNLSTWSKLRKIWSKIIYKEDQSPHLNNSQAYDLNVQGWKVLPAPLPEDIIWKNLGVSYKRMLFQRILIIIAEILVFVGILSFTIGLAIYGIYRDLKLSVLYYPLGGESIWWTVLSKLSVLLPTAIAVVDEVFAPIIRGLEQFACHKYQIGLRRTLLWHTTFYNMMGGLVLSRMVYFGIGATVLYHSSPPFNTYHYIFNKTGLDMMKYVCIKTFTVYGIKLAVVGGKTWVAYMFNKRDIEIPEFDYNNMFAQKIVVIFCVLLWGSSMPLILVLGVLYLGVTWGIDKWLIVTFYKKCKSPDSQQLSCVSDILSVYIAILPSCTLIILSTFFHDHYELAIVLLLFSGSVAVGMFFLRRWQTLKLIKGKRKYVGVGTTKSNDGTETASTLLNTWKQFTGRLSTIKDGGKTLSASRVDCDFEGNEYDHPLCKKGIQ